VILRASFTAFTACSITCSGAMRSFICMWIGEVAMKVWMRPASASASASPARRMSLSFARASEQTVESLMMLGDGRTASKSPGTRRRSRPR
jgi:hypothetical protein